MRRREPRVVQTLRSTVAAVIAYVIALHLTTGPAPLTAPLTALLVVQVTLYATLTTGIRRVNAVVAGVLLAVGFSALVGLTWWSLALIILASLIVGHYVRVSEFVPEVAISAMLVLGVSQVTNTAWNRVVETLTGAVVGLIFNFLIAPPVWTRDAGTAITDLAGRMRALLRSIAAGLDAPQPVADAAARLHEARQLDHEVADVDAALRRAEDSLRLNPRVREGLLHRVVLRTGLDTLEICTVVLRVLARTMTDLARQRGAEPLFPPDLAAEQRELYEHLAAAIENFALLVTTPATHSAETAETRLAEELAAADACRARVAGLLLDQARDHPPHWQLYGALLTEVDRIIDELDLERRSQRLLDGLDAATRKREERFHRLKGVASKLSPVS
nr:aromatic acid exporter family protein [Streptomyces coryli]